MTYPTKAALVAYMDALVADGDFCAHSAGYSASGDYILDHGEYARRDYVPTRYKDGWSLKVKYYYNAGTLYAPKDGRVDDDFYTQREDNEAMWAAMDEYRTRLEAGLPDPDQIARDAAFDRVTQLADALLSS